MSSSGLLLAVPRTESFALADLLLRLKQMVINGATAANSKRNYAQALDHLFAFAPVGRLIGELLLEWRAAIENQSPSTVNIRLSAMRRLIAEAKNARILSSEEAETLSGVPNIKQAGIRLGDWLTREQAKEILAVPDRSKLKGKRDYVILSLLVACALRRTELTELDVAAIQQREGRWVLALRGKAPTRASVTDSPISERFGKQIGVDVDELTRAMFLSVRLD